MSGSLLYQLLRLALRKAGPPWQTPQQLSLLFMFCGLQHENAGFSWPSRSTLARASRLSPRSALRVTRELEDLGLVERLGQESVTSTNRYRVTLDGSPALSRDVSGGVSWVTPPPTLAAPVEKPDRGVSPVSPGGVMGGTRGVSPVSPDLQDDQLDRSRTATRVRARRSPSLPGLVGLAAGDRASRAPKGNNFASIEKAARDVLADPELVRKLLKSKAADAIANEGDHHEATKVLCAKRRIDYGRHDAVPMDSIRNACASARFKYFKPGIVRGAEPRARDAAVATNRRRR